MRINSRSLKREEEGTEIDSTCVTGLMAAQKLRISSGGQWRDVVSSIESVHIHKPCSSTNRSVEHALASKLAESPLVDCIHVVPGNGGTAGYVSPTLKVISYIFVISLSLLFCSSFD